MRAKVLVVALACVLASLAYAGPDTITYQGSLLNHLGGPVTDGTYQMQFKIFDAATAGTNRWQETDNVQVTRGLFSTILGDSTPFGGLFLSYPDLWLEATIDVDRSGTFEGNEVFSPRQNLTGVPWACPRLEPNDTSPNMIGGHTDNATSAGVVGATIGGGGTFSRPNRVTDNFGTVGGGTKNQAGDETGTVTDAYYATVAGGYGNTASGNSATVPGGRDNTAQGDYSFAAGRRAKAEHKGSFVWADSTDADFESQFDNQFRVRANGGARFDVNNNHWVSIRYVQTYIGSWVILTSTGASLTAGGAWVNNSDRNAKENFALVDGREVLARLAEVPVKTWNHKNESPLVRHMGPMAQDLYAAFGLGSSNKSIATIDADGISLAAIQGLYEIVREKDADIARLRVEKDAEITELRARLAALEAQVATIASQKSGRGQ